MERVASLQRRVAELESELSAQVGLIALITVVALTAQSATPAALYLTDMRNVM